MLEFISEVSFGVSELMITMDIQAIALSAVILFILIGLFGEKIGIFKSGIKLSKWERFFAFLFAFFFAIPFISIFIYKNLTDGIIHEGKPDSSKHEIGLMGLEVKSDHNPPLINDVLTVEFTLSNDGEKDLGSFRPFIAVRDPFRKNMGDDDGYLDEITFKSRTEHTWEQSFILDAKGSWTFWPCYTFSGGKDENERWDTNRTTCPNRWASFLIKVEDLTR